MGLVRSRFHARMMWALLLCLPLMAGCRVGRYVTYVIGGDEGGKVRIEAQYRGLASQRTAVLVAADEHMLFDDPAIQEDLCVQISSLLVTAVPDAEVVDAAEVAAVLGERPHWQSATHEELIEAMGVDRLLMIDVVRYSLHEPGNAYVAQGAIDANVSVIEAGGADGARSVFAVTLGAGYPEGSTVGRVNADMVAIRAGTLMNFAIKTVNLFRDYEVIE